MNLRAHSPSVGDAPPGRAWVHGHRGIEVVHAYEEALEILTTYRPAQPSRLAYGYRAGTGAAATEAPRGTIYHRYAVDAEGKVTQAQIVPPTSQNQAQIEADLRRWVARVLSDDEARTARQCENFVRNYDPCISCSTHFLKVRVERGKSQSQNSFTVEKGSASGEFAS